MATQTKLEEQLNTITHAIGAFLGVIGLILLLYFNTNKTSWSTFSVIVYGISVIILFTASALYHYETDELKKSRLRILDHISIYLLIAGSYTPVVLILLAQSSGWALFTTVWLIAGLGILLKLFFTGKFEALSLLLYLAMGWLIVLDYSSLKLALHENGQYLLIAGGLAYTLGIVFYAVDKIPYNHVIWHLFVLAGAACHYFMVLFYVI